MDKTSKVPLYLQLMEVLIKKIEDEEYAEHDKLPSERDLCDIYKLSRITVRQALQDLEREGYIYKQHGVGTFVASASYNQKLSGLYSFTNEMQKLGKNPTTEVLSFEVISLDDRLARKMDAEPFEEVFKVVRLRFADGQPLMYETSYLPKKRFVGLTQTDLNARPMYDVFLQDYEVTVTKATERLSATLVTEEESMFLDMRSGEAGMLIKRYAYFHEQLIEYTVSVARGDKFSYTVELS